VVKKSFCYVQGKAFALCVSRRREAKSHVIFYFSWVGRAFAFWGHAIMYLYECGDCICIAIFPLFSGICILFLSSARVVCITYSSLAFFFCSKYPEESVHDLFLFFSSSAAGEDDTTFFIYLSRLWLFVLFYLDWMALFFFLYFWPSGIGGGFWDFRSGRGRITVFATRIGNGRPQGFFSILIPIGFTGLFSFFKNNLLSFFSPAFCDEPRSRKIVVPVRNGITT